MDIQVYLSANQTLQYWVTHHEKNDNYLLEHCSRGGIRAILIAVPSPKHQSNMNVLSCYFLTKDNITKVLFALKKMCKIKAHLPVTTTIDVFLSKSTSHQQGGIRSSHRGATPITSSETKATHLQNHSTASSPSSDSQQTLTKTTAGF